MVLDIRIVEENEPLGIQADLRSSSSCESAYKRRDTVRKQMAKFHSSPAAPEHVNFASLISRDRQYVFQGESCHDGNSSMVYT
jgi:hypothetical protein